MSNDPVGLIGAGLLGQSLAHCLLQSGYQVMGFDLDPLRCEDLQSQGAVTAHDANGVSQQCRTIFLSLPDSTVVAQVISIIQAELRPGDIIIDTTTGNPADTRVISEQLAGQEVTYLDATIVGSSVQVRSRDAMMLIGGQATAVSQCQPLLEAVSKHYLHLGDSGSGATMKLIVNLVLGLNRAVLAEGLALASACGMNGQQVLDVLRQGPAYSTVMDTKGSKMVLEEFVAEARLAQHLKDVQLIRQLGVENKHPLPLSQAHEKLLERAVQLGYGAADNSAVIMASHDRQAKE